MAEIHVERKRGVAGWVWVLLLVLLIAAAAIYLWQAGYVNLGALQGSATHQLAVDGTTGGFNGA